MDEQRAEAYRTYMSDSFAILHTALTRGEIEIPRYADMFEGGEDQQPEQTADEVFARFSNLRRPE